MPYKSYRLTPGFILSALFIVLIMFLLCPWPAHAANRVLNLVTDNQGILPKSGPIEVLRIFSDQTVKDEAYLSDPDMGYIRFEQLNYQYIDEDLADIDVWLIYMYATETAQTGTAGYHRFAVARSRLGDHEFWQDGELEPLFSDATGSVLDWVTNPIWHRKENPDYQPDPDEPSYSPWRYLDARVPPNADWGTQYNWGFEVPDPDTGAIINGGSIVLTIRLCGAGFGLGDQFQVWASQGPFTLPNDDVEHGGLYIENYTSITFMIDDIVLPGTFPGEIDATDFDSFSLYQETCIEAPYCREEIFDRGQETHIATLLNADFDLAAWPEITDRVKMMSRIEFEIRFTVIRSVLIGKCECKSR